MTNKKIVAIAKKTLIDIDDVLKKIKEPDYKKQVSLLNNATIGQHVRHILEFYKCLIEGISTGILNYDNRQRSTDIEEDQIFASTVLHGIIYFLNNNKKNEIISMEINYLLDDDHSTKKTIFSNYYRELVYNIDHSVHHMAIIRIGLKEAAPYITLPPDFGVANSTIQHQMKKTKQPKKYKS